MRSPDARARGGGALQFWVSGLAELMYDLLESSVAKDLVVANFASWDPGPVHGAGDKKVSDARAGDNLDSFVQKYLENSLFLLRWAERELA